MAKDLKLHIKNVQIADAINLRGLKAKLSKKKGEEEAVAPQPAAPREALAEEAVAASGEKKKRSSKPKQEEGVLTPAAPIAPSIAAPSIEETAKSEKPAFAKAPPKMEPKIEPKAEISKTETLKPQASKVEAAKEETPKPQPKPIDPREKLGPVKDHPAQHVPLHSQRTESQRTERPAPSTSRSGWRDVPQQTRPAPRERPPQGQPYPQSYPPRSGQPPRPGGHQGSGAPRPSGYQGAGGQRPGGYQGAGGDRPRGYQGTGAPRPGGYQGAGGPRPGGYQGGGQGRGPGAPGSYPARRIPPLSRPTSEPPKQTDRPQRQPEKRVITDREIEEELFRRTKGKPKDTREQAKPVKKPEGKDFDQRIRQVLRGEDTEAQVWRKKRPLKSFRSQQEQEIIRPSKIAVRIPISVKDLAQEMKLKASELISKLFLQGAVVTLNDMLEDETMIQLLGHEFDCEIDIDTREEERIRITGKTITEEIKEADPGQVIIRCPVVAFMGHVDHGKTSLIDAIRKSNRAQHEVGAITQHIGAFRCHTAQGDITILDTPGHEAFSNMRERGTEITDIVVLVVAGDEGMKEQTFEALAQAQESKATIVVAINKSDKPGFNAETVYRQLADRNLLPETWGGQTITVNCSAVTGEGIIALLEMLALQAEVLELRADPSMRARGTVIESQVDKGLGPVSTVLVQNGTLRVGDCLVFGYHWARIKTMRDQDGKEIVEAGPSTPVRINGLSGLPEAGEEFIVVKSEREARDISSVRQEGRRQTGFQVKRRLSFEGMVEKATDVIIKKVLTVILRADVQGSLEALKNALLKIESNKVEVNIISAAVGLITESDVSLAQTSKAVLIGFHTQVEPHVEPIVKELGVQVRLHDIIYHAVDDVRDLMRLLLDKIKQEKATGVAEVKATFKSSHLGLIAGCQVTEGTILRNNHIRVMRAGLEVWKGPIGSIKRNKDDVREVQKGMECGILLQGFADFQVGDMLEAFEVIYLSQDL